MNNVIIFEVLRALKKKSFWVASLMPPLIILAVMGIEYFSVNGAKSSSAAQSQAAVANTKIAVFDESGLIDQKFFAAAHIAAEPSREAGIGGVTSGAIGAFIYYPADVASGGIQIYSQDLGLGQTPYNDLATKLLTESVVEKVGAAVTSTQAIKILQSTPPVNVTTYKNGAQTLGFANAIAPGIIALAFLLLIMLLSPFMIASTAEEKENRASEILLTSIKTRDLVGGKIFSVVILGIVQLAVIIAPVVIAAFRFPAIVPAGISFGNIPLDPLAITISTLFLIAGFTMYTGLIMGVGSMVPGTNTANRFMGVFIIWVFVPIYTISLVILSPHNIAVTILTYFPLTAPTMALIRNALGSLSIGEAAGALAIVIATAVFAIWFAVRAFRYGSMEHGRRIGLKELFLR